MNSQEKINQNIKYLEPYQSKQLFNANNFQNNMDEEMEKKNNELNSLYNKEYNYRNNQIYRKVNSQKLNTILNSEQQKIENNLEYYNKELKINQKKKELILNKLFGCDYTKSRVKTNYDKDKDSNLINNLIDENNNFGVNKYLVKDNNNINYKNIKDSYEINRNNNKYKFVYNPYKVVNGVKNEVKKKDIFNGDNPPDIVGSFDFQRKHHFS
mgnify:CR=1 FL=1